MLDFLPRILWHCLKALLGPRLDLNEDFSSTFRAWPFIDTDGFRYLSVPRYIAAAGTVIWAHAFRAGFFGATLKNGWVFVIKRQNAQFYKPIRIFARYTAKSRLVAWNEFSFIRRVEFYRGETLHARMYFQIFTLSKRGKIRAAEVLEKSNKSSLVSEPWPAEIAEWTGAN